MIKPLKKVTEDLLQQPGNTLFQYRVHAGEAVLPLKYKNLKSYTFELNFLGKYALHIIQALLNSTCFRYYSL